MNYKIDTIPRFEKDVKKLKKKFSYNNITILVRAIFQTREFEERFLKIGMGYRIIGGIKFMKEQR